MRGYLGKLRGYLGREEVMWGTSIPGSENNQYKNLGLEHAWCGQGTARKLMWLEQCPGKQHRMGSERKWRRQERPVGPVNPEEDFDFYFD